VNVHLSPQDLVDALSARVVDVSRLDETPDPA
jgi:hypothetical protein